VKEFELQPATDLPTSPRTGRLGGTYAKAFTKSGSNINAINESDENTTSWDESGLLYEMSLYWHYSDLADNLRRGDPSSIPCYGDSNYSSALTQELGGLTLGEYDSLIAGLTGVGGLIEQYADLLDALDAALASGDQDAVNQALLALGQLLADNPDLAEYAHYRDYAPGHVPEQHLLDLDKGLYNPDGGDGGNGASGTTATPGEDIGSTKETIDVTDTEGRSSWIDLRP